MTWKYVLKDEDVVIEDEVHAVIDLTKSKEIESYPAPKYDLVAWNKEENCVFGLLQKAGESYNLSVTVANFGQPTVRLDEVLKIRKKNFEAMLIW